MRCGVVLPTRIRRPGCRVAGVVSVRERECGEKGTHGEAFSIPVRNVSPEFDDYASHLGRLYEEEGRLAVRVGDVDVAALRDEVAQDVKVVPGRGGVERGIGVLVGDGRGESCMGESELGLRGRRPTRAWMTCRTERVR